ncbi:hypothetical protein [Virgibacillus proomii]|uniref:hypothetical protein n=1 Tax=Virgibacillus proomii TaxID=84407 RepID=UPI001C0F8B8D|nr:hypothetical protein [Virgibacillus proomii]MBU5267966.1 hypothetical protein [Virgibacillus proomii]
MNVLNYLLKRVIPTTEIINETFDIAFRALYDYMFIQGFLHVEKSFFFFKDKKSYDSDTSHAEKVFFFFKDKKSYDSDTSHVEKVFFLFKGKKSYDSDTSHAEKVFFFFKEKSIL